MTSICILCLRIAQMALYLTWCLKNVSAFLNIKDFSEKLPEELVKQYAAQLVSVLEYLQSKRVMHRDLKPQNIMLDENFNLKVVRNTYYHHPLFFRLTLAMPNVWTSLMTMKRNMVQEWAQYKKLLIYSRSNMNLDIWRGGAHLWVQLTIWPLK
jgi:serine/threonine protein kinase